MFIGQEKGPMGDERNQQLTICGIPITTRVGWVVSTWFRYSPSCRHEELVNGAIIGHGDPHDLICASAMGFAWIVTWVGVRKQFAVGIHWI